MELLKLSNEELIEHFGDLVKRRALVVVDQGYGYYGDDMDDIIETFDRDVQDAKVAILSRMDSSEQ